MKVLYRQDQFSISRFEPGIDEWPTVRQEMVALEQEAFTDRADTTEFLEQVFKNPSNIILLLKNDASHIIGYTYAAPDTRTDPTTVGYMESIALLPSYQGKGLVGPLTNVLESELRQRGFQFMALKAQVNNGYADKLLRHYGDHILETYEVESRYGLQRYFKIKL